MIALPKDPRMVEVKCPACHAAAGEFCRVERKTKAIQRLGLHAERWRRVPFRVRAAIEADLIKRQETNA